MKLIDDLSFEIIYQMFFINELSLNNKSPIYGMKDKTLNLLMALIYFHIFRIIQSIQQIPHDIKRYGVL